MRRKGPGGKEWDRTGSVGQTDGLTKWDERSDLSV